MHRVNAALAIREGQRLPQLSAPLRAHATAAAAVRNVRRHGARRILLSCLRRKRHGAHHSHNHNENDAQRPNFTLSRRNFSLFGQGGGTTSVDGSASPDTRFRSPPPLPPLDSERLSERLKRYACSPRPQNLRTATATPAAASLGRASMGWRSTTASRSLRFDRSHESPAA